MKNFSKIAAIVACLSLNLPVHAGARSGYRLVYFDISPLKNTETTKLVIDYFNSALPSETYRCADSNRYIDIEIVFVNKRPKALTSELVNFSLRFDKDAMKQLRKILRTYRDSEIDKGFDGIVSFKKEGTSYELTTIGSTDNGYMRSFKVNDPQGLSPKTLNKLFCNSLADLAYAYGE